MKKVCAMTKRAREFFIRHWTAYYGYHCAYCTVDCKGYGKGLGTIDHIIPRAKGGTNKITNLVFACEACNQKKGCRDISKFRPLMLSPLRWDTEKKQVVGL